MSGIGMSTLAAVAATLWAGAGCVCATAEVAPEISATVTASSPITDSIRLFLKLASKEFRSGRKVPHNTVHKSDPRRHARDGPISASSRMETAGRARPGRRIFLETLRALPALSLYV